MLEVTSALCMGCECEMSSAQVTVVLWSLIEVSITLKVLNF